MAGNTIDINLSVQDQGKTLQGRTNDAKRLNEQLERAQNLMRGTKTGNQAMRRAGLDPAMGGEVSEYNRARGAAQVGGASARDFADQARGLGGLVRLYATYAANIFAVTAAFNALREAMQTDMMIRSLDQLGAATGTAMGGIAKQFAAASDGAISLREAAEATAKAMSSGMTRDQFIQLGEVAKGAAQALGLNMGDAVSRLTRGIVKLEPELLDELGLFTKVGKAAEDYARSVGKTEAQLTDFERRQAFANAVLKEGREKFGEIAQEGNPYDRLLAQLKNVAQDILTVVNNLVAPIAKLLADNTGLIAGAIGLAALKITKTALPALGEWRKGLEVAATDAAKKAEMINESFQKAFSERQERALGIPALEKNLELAKRQLKQAQQELLGAAGGMDKRIAKSKWFGVATTEDVANEKSIAKLTETSAKLSQSEAANKQAIAAAMTKVANAQKLVLERSQALANVDNTLQEGLQKRATILTELWQREKIRDDAASKAARLRILSQVSTDVDERGLAGGIKELYGKVQAEQDLGRLAKFGTVFQGVMIASARAVGILGAALNRAFLIIEVITGAFLFFDSLFSTNSKAVREFDSNINILEENTKTATLTVEKFKGQLSFESIIASANAFTGLTEAVNSVAESFRKAEQASGRWNKSLDAIKDFLPGLSSRQEIAAENLGEAVAQAIRTVPEGEIREELQGRLQSILGNVELTGEGIEKALNKLDKESFRSVSKVLGLTLKDTDEVLTKSKNLAKNVEEAGKAALQSYQTLANSVKDNSPLSVFVANNLKRVQALELSFKDATAARAALDKLSKEGGIELFGNYAVDVKKLTIEFDELNKLSKEYSSNIFEQERGIEATKKAMEGLYETDPIRKRLEKEIASTVNSINDTKTRLNDVESKILSIQKKLADTVQNAIREQIDAIFTTYDLRLQKIRIDAEKTRASLGTGVQTKQGIDYRAQLDIQAIDTENALAKINEDLVLKTELNRIALESLTDQLELNRLESIRQTSPGNLRKLEEIAPKITALETKRDTTGRMREEAIALTQQAQGGDKGALSRLKDLVRQEGGAGFLPLVELLQRKQERDLKATLDKQNIEARRQFENIGLSFDNRIKQLNDIFTQVNQQLQGVSGFLPSGVNQQLQIFSQDLKNRADVLAIDKQIAQEEKLRDLARTAGDKATRQANIDKLQDNKKVLEQTQAEQRQIAARNAEIQVGIDLSKEQSQQTTQTFETLSKYAAGSISADQITRESIRQAIAGVREKELQDTFNRKLKPLQDLQDKFTEELKTKTEAELLTPAGQTLKNAANTLGQAITVLTKQENAAKGIRAADEELNKFIASRDIEIQQSRERLELLEIESNLIKAILDLETTRLENSISIAENSLSINERLNLLTKDQINQEKRRLQTLRIEQNLKTGLNDLDREKIALEQQYQDELKIAGGELPTIAEARFTQQFQQNELRRKALLETANAQRTILEEQAKLNDRTEYYSNSFNNMFQGMADAIVEFAKTGKFNFKDLINSFIADITRYELRLQATEAYVAARPFLVKLLGNLFAPNTATGGSSFNSYVNAGGFAKGGAFDTMGTIPGYAKGGMFTNSIVNSPTLFKAAKGLGVMGEAGPEAIMPLKRDSQGNLGVRGGGGSVEVVVNNYTQAKAETRETVDSRGNRRIEIVVADLVAGEISRPNSNVQQAFVNSFGTKPMVARR